MSLTKREKKLLYFLALFLLVTGFLLGINLLIAKNDEISVSLDEASAVSAEMRAGCESLDSLKSSLPPLEAEVNDVFLGFYPTMRSFDIDREITSVATSSGLLPIELIISDPEETTVSAFAPSEFLASAPISMTRVTLACSGTHSQFLAFIDAMAANKSLRVTSFSTTQSNDESTSNFTFDIFVYMFDA
ncbi:MAG: hypothetical protein RR058_01215 [Oscillospiraceae bacterium]